jgi:hypothetical protein
MVFGKKKSSTVKAKSKARSVEKKEEDVIEIKSESTTEASEDLPNALHLMSASEQASKKRLASKTVTAETKKSLSSKIKKSSIKPGHDDIALAAWELWQKEGCPEGRHIEHWLAAEEKLIQ